MKLIQSIKKQYLDKCTFEELQSINNEVQIKNLNMNKQEIIRRFIASSMKFNFKEKINFKPVYYSKKKNNPCLKDGFKIIRKLGNGEYGLVHLVEKNKKKYAMKKINIAYNNWSTIGEQLKSIKNEIKVLKKISNLGISPKLYDYYLCKDKNQFSIYLIMEYINGITLRKFLEENTLTKNIENKIKNVFDKLHNNGILHGDVHDENIMITEKKRVYIIDFGFSQTLKDFLDKKYNFLFKGFDTETIKRDILASILIKMKII